MVKTLHTSAELIQVILVTLLTIITPTQTPVALLIMAATLTPSLITAVLIIVVLITAIKDGSSDSSNTDNGNNSSGGFLASKPTTSDQPKTHWSKTKNSHYGVVNTYTGDGGSFDGRTLVGGGRRLSESDAGDSDLVRLVGLWGAEKQYFVYGTFPDVSSTGDWSDVGHYTQLVWANTKQVGCGIANGHGNEYLVCQYYPAGNFDSETVY